MRTILYTGLMIAVTGTTALAADPNGDWLVEDGVAQIRIVDCGSNKWGVVAWEKIPGGLDKENPDVSKRNRPTLGMPILLNLKKKATAEEWEGKVYNAENGKTYDSKIKLLAQDKLEIKGCIMGFLCGGQVWSRVADTQPAPGSVKGAPGQKATPSAAAPKAAASNMQPTAGAKAPPAATKGGTLPANPLDDICAIPEIVKATGTTGRAIN